MILTKELYKSILQANYPKFDNLRVITGYTSSDFLLRVHRDFPKLKIDVYIGMALQGISKEDHSKYCELRNQGDIRVWYVYRQPMIHQKVLDFFSEDGHNSYVGSANFSNSGFGVQKEIMALVDNRVSDVFEEAMNEAIICTSSDVEGLIPMTHSPQDSGATTLVVDNVSTSQTPVKEGGHTSREWLKGSYVSGEVRIPIIRKEWGNTFIENFGVNATPPFISLKGIPISKREIFERNSVDEKINISINGKKCRAYISYDELRFDDLNIKREIASVLRLDPTKPFTVEDVENARIVARQSTEENYCELIITVD